MEIIMEDEHSVDEMKTQEQFHFAMSGKSFAVISEHFQDLLQKVQHFFFFFDLYKHGLYYIWYLLLWMLV